MPNPNYYFWLTLAWKPLMATTTTGADICFHNIKNVTWSSSTNKWNVKLAVVAKLTFPQKKSWGCKDSCTSESPFEDTFSPPRRFANTSFTPRKSNFFIVHTSSGHGEKKHSTFCSYVLLIEENQSCYKITIISGLNVNKCTWFVNLHFCCYYLFLRKIRIQYTNIQYIISKLHFSLQKIKKNENLIFSAACSFSTMRW